MADPGAHAGGLFAQSGSVVFDHEESRTVNIGTAHLEVVTVQTSTTDGAQTASTIFDAGAPTNNRMLSFNPADSAEGVGTRRINTVCGIEGTGLNQATSPGDGSQPWTLAFWAYFSKTGNSSPPDRPNGYYTHIMNYLVQKINFLSPCKTTSYNFFEFSL